MIGSKKKTPKEVLSATFNRDQKSDRPSRKRKRPAPLSLRVSDEERAQIIRDAAGMPMNAYLRSRLLKPTKSRKIPPTYQEALARALRRLAHSGVSGYLVSQITAFEEGRLQLSTNEERDLRAAYSELYLIRNDLISALGLKGE